jgi:hypothetical protein
MLYSVKTVARLVRNVLEKMWDERSRLVLSQNLPGGTVENHENLIMIVGVPFEL